MTDNNEIIKTSGEVSSEKIKAIYPHIVVSGDIDKPYYSIQYYDIEKKTMFDCYGSYKLGLVRKWLEEHFEVIEPDIADFINRQKAEIERLQEENKSFANIGKMYSEIKAEAIKECLNKVAVFCAESGLFQCEADEMLLFNYLDSLKMEAMLKANGMAGDKE